MTKYARDEFDRVPETPTRQGVHRAVAESRSRGRLGSILAVGVAALAVGLVTFLILPKLGFSSAGETTAVSAEQGSGSAAASPATTDSTPVPGSEPSSPAASAPAEANPAASALPSASATPSAAAAVDKTQPVAVFNGTTTAGLANRVGGTVSTAGWKIGTMGNWGGAPQQRSVIFYSGAAQKGNADALGELLGIPTVVDSAEFQLPLVVVLAPGFQ
ncbi:LytR C-terminal domain-containing protein [Pseudarthrobacter sp. PvP090]|uniref:LytR C-terminal domain-containing protein n=1 Tax=Pseudarthrobacter sp. PvP090 TaxID=3156393 RepID=UPI003390BC43